MKEVVELISLKPISVKKLGAIKLYRYYTVIQHCLFGKITLTFYLMLQKYIIPDNTTDSKKLTVLYDFAKQYGFKLIDPSEIPKIVLSNQ